MLRVQGFTLGEQVARGGQSRVFAGTRDADGLPIVAKVALDHRDLRHEHALANRLAGDGIVEVVGLAHTEEGDVLLERRFGDMTLATVLRDGPLPVERALRVAHRVATILARVHAARVVSRDITPSNVLLDSQTGELMLADFGIAAELPPGERRLPVTDFLGTPAYVAPEQTGRTREGVDRRSDLYSLGALLYEALTGTPPFSGDVLELLSAHISRRPDPPHERVPAIPRPLSALVMKLLAKSPDERYQSATGVAIDLQRCLDQLAIDGSLSDFPLGDSDLVPLPFPARTFARGNQVAVLTDAFQRARVGRPVPVLVLGADGSGRAALVRDFVRTMAPADQWTGGAFNGTEERPLAVLSCALNELATRLLLLEPNALAALRDRLSAALGAVGGVITDLAPAFLDVLGPQPPLPVLGSTETRARFLLAFRRLFAGLGSEEVFVLVLDGVEQADASTKALLHALLDAEDVGRLLLVLSSADAAALADYAGRAAVSVQVPPLSAEQTDAWVAEVLQCGAGEPRRALAELLFERTGGEVVLLEQLLVHLVETGSIRRCDGRWSWEIVEVLAAPPPPSTDALAASRVGGLAPERRRVLEALACQGGGVALAGVAAMTGDSNERAGEMLAAMVREGLVLQHESHFSVAQRAVADAVLAASAGAERHALYTRYGRHLLATLSDAVLKERAYEVATALARGEAPELPAARGRAAQCFRIAGERALGATDVEAARGFFEHGLRLLGAAGWKEQRELTFALEVGRGRALALVGQMDDAEAAYAAVCARELTPLEVAVAYGGRCENFHCASERARAVNVGLQGLARLGERVPAHPSQLRSGPLILRNQRRLGRLSMAEIVARPACTDDRAQAIVALVVQLLSPAYFFDPNLLVLLAEIGVSYYLKHGHFDAAAFLLCTHSLVLNGAFKRYDSAYALVKAVEALLGDRTAPGFAAKTLLCGFGTTAAFYRDWREVASTMAIASTRGQEEGDPLYAAYCACNEIDLLCLAGASLPYIAERCQVHARGAAKTESSATQHVALVGNVARRCAAGEALEAADLDPFLAFDLAARNMRNEAMIDTAFAVLASGHEATVRDWVADIGPNFEEVCFGMPSKIDLWTLEGLCLARDRRAGRRRARRDARKRLSKMEKLRACTRAPVAARIFLLEAEIARAERRTAESAEYYGKAAVAARELESYQILAFALEGRAELLCEMGLAEESSMFYREALQAYRRWGHLTKVRALVAAHPELAPESAGAPITAGEPVAKSHTQVPRTQLNQALDLRTVLKVSQQISTRLHASEVVKAVLLAVAENAGAERAVLVLRGADSEADVYGVLEGREYQELGVPLDRYDGVPKSLIRLVHRSGRAVAIADAASCTNLGDDRYVLAHKCRSLACIPVVRKGEVVGELVLENNLVAGAFTEALLELAQALVTQAAISLDNAALYENMEARVRERTEALNERNRQSRLVLDNVAQGLAVVDREGAFGSERSTIMERWFDEGVPETLSELFAQYAPDQHSAFELGWMQLIDDILPFELACEQLPAELAVHGRELALAWQPILDDDCAAGASFERMLLVLSDVTDLRRQERAEQEQREELALLERLARDRDGVLEFSKEASATIAQLSGGDLSPEIEKRLVHTLKGNFGLFGIGSLSRLCHELEQAVKNEDRALTSEERRALAAAWSRKAERLTRYLTLDEDFLQVYRQDYESALRALRRDSHPLLHDLELWSFEPLKVRLTRIAEQAKAIAERVGKGPLQVHIEHGGFRLEQAHWSSFWASFVHAVRNAIDHGLESPEERAAAGKGRPTLRLRAALLGDRFLLECADDGRGVDWEKIREKARAAGLPCDTLAELTRALFADGVSTRDEVSELSGRGVGMAALAAACDEMGGTIEVDSKRAHGTVFRFSFSSDLAHQPHERWVSEAPAHVA